MAKYLAPEDRLQPALLDRITDLSGRARDSDAPLTLNKQQLRQAVLRDLAWLFNAIRLESSQDMTRTPLARQSVINFGLPSLAGETASTLDVMELERAIRQAILDFEPRILPSNLQVTAITDMGDLDHHNVISVEIRGELWGQPLPLELLLRTELDLENGNVKISDLGAGARARQVK